MVLSCDRQTIPYQFTILDSDMVNAFAIPGGYIYVTRGLLSHFNSEVMFFSDIESGYQFYNPIKPKKPMNF